MPHRMTTLCHDVRAARAAISRTGKRDESDFAA
jgi:hypothetical protein